MVHTRIPGRPVELPAVRHFRAPGFDFGRQTGHVFEGTLPIVDFLSVVPLLGVRPVIEFVGLVDEAEKIALDICLREGRESNTGRLLTIVVEYFFP